MPLVRIWDWAKNNKTYSDYKADLTDPNDFHCFLRSNQSKFFNSDYDNSTSIDDVVTIRRNSKLSSNYLYIRELQ